jgi:RNA polymerase sigma-70 factor (ECF subfamily)
MDRPRLSAEAQVRFRQMVDQDFEFIWRALRGLGVPASGADDAAQQVFLVAAQKLDGIEPGAERSFLFSTARGVASNARRSSSRNREQYDEDSLAMRADHAPNPEQLASAGEARAVLERLLEDFPEELRTVFVLFELEGMTMAEIAEVLGIPNGTVASRLRRARDDFQAAARRFQAQNEGRKGWAS